MTVGELQQRIGSRELSEWMAYDRINLPDEAMRHAQLCALTVSYSGFAKKAARPGDFLPKRHSQRALPEADLLARNKMLAAAHKNKV